MLRICIIKDTSKEKVLVVHGQTWPTTYRAFLGKGLISSGSGLQPYVADFLEGALVSIGTVSGCTKQLTRNELEVW